MNYFIEQIMEILEIEDQVIEAEDKFREYAEWDSLAYLSILAMINEEYDIVISRNIFDNFVTVKDIYDYIERNK